MRDGATPLWIQLGDDLERRIAASEFPGAFPGELRLAAEYGVSRQTVRAALRSLRESGMVSAGRGRHSKVLARRIEQPLGGPYSLFSSVRSAGMTQRSTVRGLTRTENPEAAGRLGLPDGAPLIHLSRIRCADDEPLALDDVWLPAILAAPLLDADFSHTALYTELEQRCGLRPHAGEETIDAVVLTADAADLLAVSAGSPAFRIQRLGLADEQPVEWRETVVRADRFRLRAAFGAREGYRPPADGPAD